MKPHTNHHEYRVDHQHCHYYRDPNFNRKRLIEIFPAGSDGRFGHCESQCGPFKKEAVIVFLKHMRKNRQIDREY
ncbi:hypothetical protein E2C01_062065 [Portunus trituberculatus]|uniref:Uncharacterized protein n=1 Tax=Portunus trituberculatus TaxID=210409 RepID=A0A5B7HDJ3_PORTR|nr:hypothetical protein [Portunus trituberculatus]